MLKIGILASGSLGLKTVQFMAQSGHELVCVLTDKGSTEISTFCVAEKIPCFSGNPRNGKGYEFFRDFEIEVLASVNYLFLIERDLIEYPSGIAFNIHGSLLPKYRGRTPHVWAIINGEKQTGITAHFIDPNCDTGDIIAQITVPIGKEDTGADILNKYTELYIPLLDLVLEKYQNNRIHASKQREEDATYFEKRTPESGHINWSWKSERIRNWVRAQANPYPGAFGFIGVEKIIIDKVKHSSEDLPKEYLPGQLKKTDGKWLCATSDAFVELVSIRSGKDLLEPKKIIE